MTCRPAFRLAAQALVLIVLGGCVVPRSSTAGLPGYVEWVLWKETDTITATEPPEGHQLDFEWLIGPYPELLECQVERNALQEVILLEAKRKYAAAPRVVRKVGPDFIVISGSLEIVMIRLLCVPDWVNPRKDGRWQ